MSKKFPKTIHHYLNTAQILTKTRLRFTTQNFAKTLHYKKNKTKKFPCFIFLPCHIPPFPINLFLSTIFPHSASHNKLINCRQKFFQFLLSLPCFSSPTPINANRIGSWPAEKQSFTGRIWGI
jgi:hypothetical protein